MIAKMHVITDVKMIVVDVDERDPRYWIDIVPYSSDIVPDFSASEEMAARAIKQRLLTGRRFTRQTESSLETWIIAHDNPAAEILGLGFEDWNCLQKENNKNKFALNNLRELSKLVDKELYAYRYMGFFGRLKFLFTGKADV